MPTDITGVLAEQVFSVAAVGVPRAQLKGNEICISARTQSHTTVENHLPAIDSRSPKRKAACACIRVTAYQSAPILALWLLLENPNGGAPNRDLARSEPKRIGRGQGLSEGAAVSTGRDWARALRAASSASSREIGGGGTVGSECICASM
jgi:hypothetical protein